MEIENEFDAISLFFVTKRTTNCHSSTQCFQTLDSIGIYDSFSSIYYANVFFVWYFSASTQLFHLLLR